MVELHGQRKLLPSLQSIGRCTMSCVFVLLTQFALCLVPRFFYASPFLIQFALSVLMLLLVLGFGRWCKRLLGVRASAPAFVFFTILFIWGVYIAIVRQAVSSVVDVLFNGEVSMLIIGLCSILLRDPGFVIHESPCSEELVESSSFAVEPPDENSFRSVRYCKSCKAYIKGFDHHCPAFGNCIGQNNYVLFMVLLVGFITTEASYLACTAQSVRKSQKFGRNWLETNLVGNLVIGTMVFSILQLLWQGVFLMFHIYCICFNVRTDEWINWKKYPEFQVIKSEPGLGATPSLAAPFATILVMVSNTHLVSMQERFQSKIMNAENSRIKATSETLKSTRVLKLLSWEPHIFEEASPAERN